MSFFLQAFAIVVDEEGGLSEDPNDPGGLTQYGISQRAYPNEDIRTLTLARAQTLYQRDYWARLGCDELSWEWALCLFDAGVNQGVSAALTMKAASATPAEFQAERALRYARSEPFERYGRGWMRRLFHVYKAAQVTPT